MKAVLIILAILLVIGWWQNEKEEAERENRPTVVERIVSGSTESEKALRQPESMTPEQRQLGTEWGNGSKRLYVEQVDALESRLAERMEGGYVWGPESERRVRASIRDLNSAIDRDDFLAVPGRFAEAKEALRLFEAGCRWRAGLRHRSISHIASAEREGYWNADPGWRFLQQGSLEVVRTCRHCHGSGREIVKVDCDNCNGSGWVDGPLSGVTRILGDVSDVLDGAAGAANSVNNAYRAVKGKPSKGGGASHYGSHRRSGGNGQIPCNRCNRTGQVEAVQPCHACGGQGWTR